MGSTDATGHFVFISSVLPDPSAMYKDILPSSKLHLLSVGSLQAGIIVGNKKTLIDCLRTKRKITLEHYIDSTYFHL